jgi:hypothetical protein
MCTFDLAIPGQIYQIQRRMESVQGSKRIVCANSGAMLRMITLSQRGYTDHRLKKSSTRSNRQYL